MAEQDKFGFIIHPEEWSMVRSVLPDDEISKGLFPVLDACLLAPDPSEAAAEIIKQNLCARIFWDRNVRDISKYEERLEQGKERQRKFREAKQREREVTQGNAPSRVVTQSNACNAHNTNTNTNTNTNSNTNTNPNTDIENTNRSVTVTPPPNGNGNGTEEIFLEGGIDNARKLVRAFASAVKKDQGAFFSGEWDSTTICLAVTGDFKSAKRWRQLARIKGDAAVAQECFTFWREIAAGEDVCNRGSALNTRLGKLPDQPTT